jgi:hypothetical protein
LKRSPTNTTAEFNTAIGSKALLNNWTGAGNTAIGWQTLYNNAFGSGNTAVGIEALAHNTIGVDNTAIGALALVFNDGNDNTAIGHDAGFLITGSGNVCIGESVFGVQNVDNTTWIRNVYTSVASARVVYVNSDNKIGTLVSSRRFKDEIKPMDKASETLALKPVSFRYKKEIETNGAMMFGLIAEEVEKVAPNLVTRDEKGEVETVRYHAVNIMLPNEFLKEHKKVEQQQATIGQLRSNAAKHEAMISELKKDLGVLTATLKEQATQIQKVSSQLELHKSAPQTVLNNQ